MRASFHDDYVVDLPPGHAFPMRKFVLLRDILLREGLVAPAQVVPPPEAPWELLALAHARGYLDALRDGTLDPAAVRRLGLPWSPALVRRSRRATMGTLLAARHAIEDGVAANLAGGTHHACHAHGEGYCVINDVVVAIRALRAEGGPRRAVVVDLDVHHGNGTAELLAGDGDAFTFSMHGANNFPLRKPPSSLDVALPDRTGPATTSTSARSGAASPRRSTGRGRRSRSTSRASTWSRATASGGSRSPGPACAPGTDWCCGPSASGASRRSCSSRAGTPPPRSRRQTSTPRPTARPRSPTSRARSPGPARPRGERGGQFSFQAAASASLGRAERSARSAASTASLAIAPSLPTCSKRTLTRFDTPRCGIVMP